MKFTLPRELETRLSTAMTDLAHEHEDLQNAFDEKSERWQDSEKGEMVKDWLDNMNYLLESFDEFDSANCEGKF